MSAWDEKAWQQALMVLAGGEAAGTLPAKLARPVARAGGFPVVVIAVPKGQRFSGSAAAGHPMRVRTFQGELRAWPAGRRCLGGRITRARSARSLLGSSQAAKLKVTSGGTLWPLRRAGSVHGILAVGHSQSLPAQVAEKVRELAGMLARALEAASHLEAVEERAARVSLLAEIARLCAAGMDVADRHVAVVERMNALVPFDAAAISLGTNGNERRTVIVSPEHGRARTKAASPGQGGGPSYVRRTRRPRVVEDLARSRASADRRLAQAGYHSALDLPLLHRGLLVGGLHVASRQRGAYGPDQLELLSPAAELLAVALENERAYEDMATLALTDGLTGLRNHRFFKAFLETQLARSQRSHTDLGVLLLDLDNFKAINDLFGHGAGDQLLVDFGELLFHVVRHADLVARYGGEEFVVLLPDTGAARCEQVAERIRASTAEMRAPAVGNAPPGAPDLTVSIGIAVFPKHGATSVELLEAADQALYSCKRAGRNCVRMAT